MNNDATTWIPPELTPDPLPQPMPQPDFATDAQIAEAVGVYIDEMRRRGIKIGPEHADILVRAAHIHNVWRVAFARSDILARTIDAMPAQGLIRD